MRYPGALLARYHRSDFAVLLPHRTLKEAESIAGQILKSVDGLPHNKAQNREDIMHIGVCAWRSGQSTEQVMEHAKLRRVMRYCRAVTAGRFMMIHCPSKGVAMCAGGR